MTKTRDKLNEARYFLERMKEIQQGFGQVREPEYAIQRDHFRYNLNAFLSAFRGVTDKVLPTEYERAKNSVGNCFTAWFQKEWDTLLSNNDVDFLVKVRNATIHEEPHRPKAHFHVPVSIVSAYSIPNPIITHADGTMEHADGTPVTDEEMAEQAHFKRSGQSSPPAPPITAPTQAPTVLYFFNELPPNRRRRAKPKRRSKPMPTSPTQDVMTVCADELRALETFVAKCEAQFPL